MPTGIYKRTKEMYDTRRGHTPWNKGKKETRIEVIKKLREVHKGAVPWIKGKHHSKETKEKMSKAKKGSIPWNKGKIGVYSEEARKKMSEFRLKSPMRYWLGKRRSLEDRQKMSKAQKANPTRYWLGRHHLEQTKKKISKAKKGVRLSREAKANILRGQQKRYLSGEPTSIEKKLYDELKKRGILFERQKLINGKFIVDAYIPSLNLIIEADGDYWHSLERVVKKDKAENAYLTKCGFGLLRISGTEIRDDTFKEKLLVHGIIC